MDPDIYSFITEYYSSIVLALHANRYRVAQVEQSQGPIEQFVHFCEAFVGIMPHWILLRKFFRLKLQPSTNDP
jgi:hypothetical protein